MKDTFILYTEQKEVIDNLTDEQAGKLIKAIYEYVETNQMPELESPLNLVIIPFKQNLDRNIQKWEETRQKRSEAGKKGGAPKGNQNANKQKQAKQTNQTKQAVNVNVPVPVNVNDNVTTTVVNNVGDSCVDGLQDVINFYQNNIGLITPYAVEVFTDYAEEMPYDVIVYAMKKAVEANVRTIQYIKGTLNNWQNAGVKTLIQAKEESQKFKNNKLEPRKEETEEEKIQRKLKEMEALASDKK